MSRAARVQAALYKALLRLYPASIRERWAAEMAGTFAMQIEDAASQGGWLAVAGAWHCALVESLWIVVPFQLTRPSVAVPAASLAANLAIFSGLTWSLEHPLTLCAAWRFVVTKLGG